MKKISVVALMLIVLSALLIVPSGSAMAETLPGCPDGFTLHEAGHHEGDGGHGHKHVGNDKDLNGDGWICGKHTSNDGGVHVHIDNNVPSK